MRTSTCCSATTSATASATAIYRATARAAWPVGRGLSEPRRPAHERRPGAAAGGGAARVPRPACTQHTRHRQSPAHTFERADEMTVDSPFDSREQGARARACVCAQCVAPAGVRFYFSISIILVRGRARGAGRWPVAVRGSLQPLSWRCPERCRGRAREVRSCVLCCSLHVCARVRL